MSWQLGYELRYKELSYCDQGCTHPLCEKLMFCHSQNYNNESLCNLYHMIKLSCQLISSTKVFAVPVSCDINSIFLSLILHNLSGFIRYFQQNNSQMPFFPHCLSLLQLHDRNI